MIDELNQSLSAEDINEDESIFTVGDDIAHQFYSGNFSDAVIMLKDNTCRAKDLLEYLEDKCEEYGYDSVTDQSFYNGHFSCDFWIALGSEIY